MNQTFNPYQRNVDILRGFFKKPIVLITAISFGLSIVYGFISPILTLISMFSQPDMLGNTNIRINFRAELYTILFLISFLMLYCKSCSRKPFVKLNGAVTVARVCSIIYAVLNAISLAGLIIVGIILFAFSGKIPDFAFNIFLFLIICAFISTTFAFLFYLGMSRFTGGIKYSLTSVFITKKSSVFTAVTAFLFAGSNIALSIFLYFSSSKISEMYNYLISWVESYANDVELPQFGNMSSFINTSLALSIVKSVIDVLPFILIGVLAIMYYNYIKKNTGNLVLTPVENDATAFYNGETPAQNYSAQPPVNQNNYQPYAQNGNSNFSQPYPPQNPNKNYRQPDNPVPSVYDNPYLSNSPQSAPPVPPQNFEFQPVFNNSEQPANPVNSANNNPDEHICSSCGKKSSASMNFCPYCGTKF